MDEFKPYFTNDGSVGLYSDADNDVYHSVYGALTEAYEKFVFPANIEEILKNKSEIKLLDICYGIGYNTKAFIQYTNNYLNKISNKNVEAIACKNYSKGNSIDLNENKTCTENFSNNLKNNITCEKVDSIDTNNKTMYLSNKVETIDTDNVVNKNSLDIDTIHTDNNFDINSKNICKNTKCINSIDGDNFKENECTIFLKNGMENLHGRFKIVKFLNDVNLKVLNSGRIFLKDIFFGKTKKSKSFDKEIKIQIDSIEKNNKLLSISPFINEGVNLKDVLNIDIDEAKKARKKKKPKAIKKEYRISKDINRMLLRKIYKNIDVDFVNEVRENFSRFLSRDICLYFDFLNFNRYDKSKMNVLSAFLHNIYYRYISLRNKYGAKSKLDNVFDVRLIKDDAISFLSSNKNVYDIVFLDAFTPTKCPDLWTVDFFKLVYNAMSDNSILITYSNSAAVRHALLDNNFYVGKNQHIGTIASKNPNMIKCPLDDFDLKLINSKAGIPFRGFSSGIIERRCEEVKNSTLPTASQVFKERKNAKKI